MSVYVQYFVQDPFIVHMYPYKQIELLKLSDTLLHYNSAYLLRLYNAQA